MTTVMSSPYKQAADSPSRQLLWELGRLQITDQEAFYSRLEKETHEREAVHRHALAAAAAEHDRIRRNAEIEREKLELQIEKERKRRESEDRRELDRQREEKAQREIADRKKEIARAKAEKEREREIAEARDAEDAAAAEEAKQQKLRQDADAAKKQLEKQEADRKSAKAERSAEEAAVAAENARKVQQEKSAVAASPKTHVPASQSQQGNVREAEHQKYLDIHRRLKDLRKFLSTQSGQNSTLKKSMGSMRRTIRKCVGQLTEGKGANRAPLQEIIATLKGAAAVTNPEVDITMFLASLPPSANGSNGPALLVYQLNVFAKAIVSQFINEAGVAPRSADPVGTIASHIFAMDEFRWKGISLIDILISKYHVVCPVLWGIYGNEKTTAGKHRLGWWRDDKDGPWVTEQRHAERMTGLGAGFAAISLRNYEKARFANPYPQYKYWQSLAAVVNVPPQEATQTHFIVLKAMIENNETRFLEFFGDAGLVALRKALVDFPRQAADTSVAAKAVSALPDILRRDKKLFL